MHNGNWGNGMDSSWGWIPMMFMMLVFLGGLIWLGVTLSRHNQNSTQQHLAATPTSNTVKPSAQDVLADRLARGEIDPDDYRARLDALRHGSDT